jgi:hypothetical protein
MTVPAAAAAAMINRDRAWRALFKMGKPLLR